MHWFLMLLWNWITGTGTFGRVCLCQEKIISGGRGSGSLSDGPSGVNKQTDNKKNTGRYWALKILLLKDVIRLKQVEHVKNEKKILAAISHPFIVRLWVVYLVFSTLSLLSGRTLGSAPKRRAYSDLILFLFLKIETSPSSGQRICAEQLRRVSATLTARMM